VKKRVLAVSALVVDADDRVLLILRGHQPAQGLWSVPGGSVEPGESLEDAIVREMAEETALHVVVGKKVWVATVELSAEADYEIHCFACSVKSGELMASDDAAAARFVRWQDYETLETTPQLTLLLAKAGWPRGADASGGSFTV
jgi:ADP-ribose pyrophosphatase YjhB (NUDIX family)